MTDSNEYRRRAGECLLFTQYVTSERNRQLQVQMALGWRDLADRAEQQRDTADKRADERSGAPLSRAGRDRT
jgi:hypothetical protein